MNKLKKGTLKTFSFIVRDFKSPDDFAYGQEGGTKYFENLLKSENLQNSESKMIKEQLLEVFKEVNCFLLPHPGHKVAERNSFKGYVKGLRKKNYHKKNLI